MAVLTPVFVDTSVLLAGLIELGPGSAEAQRALVDVTPRGRSKPLTAWHCCLEFFAVSTRLPAAYRVSPAEALALVGEEILGRFEVVSLPSTERPRLLERAARQGVSGGRIYDAHIAAIARAAGARTILTENTRHFAALRDEGLGVLTAREFVSLAR